MEDIKPVTVGSENDSGIQDIAVPEMTAAGKQLRATAGYLKNKYNINGTIQRAIQIGRSALLLMIKDGITRSPSGEIALYLVFCYLGVRPGAQLTTAAYSFYLTWRQDKVRPTYVDGTGKDPGRKVAYGFLKTITLEAFKGHQHLQSFELEYSVRPTTSEAS